MPDVLPLGTPVLSSPANADPLLVDAKRAAVLLGVGLRTFRAMDSAGRVPAPIRLSRGAVRWRLTELRAWLDAGAPDRSTWARLRAARS